MTKYIRYRFPKAMLIMSSEMKSALQKFVEAFEQVFDADWAYSKLQMGIADAEDDSPYDFISAKGTFLHPKVENEFEDWRWRGKLLEEYFKVKELLSEA